MGQGIVVGLNGSSGASRAASWAAEQAARTSAEVIAVHVLTYSHEFVADLPPTGLTPWRRRLHFDLRGPWTEPIRKAHVPLRCWLLEDESVARGLLDAAERQDAELIVLGTQGHPDFGGRLLSTVTSKVSRAAKQPVVVVPARWRSGAQLLPDRAASFGVR